MLKTKEHGRRVGGPASSSRCGRSWTSRATTPRVMVNNLDWTAPLSALDFLRDIGKHFRVNQMIKKDAVAARLDSDEGISLHRVQLPAAAGAGLPAALPRRTAARCRPAAVDQWGNITAGVGPHPPGRGRVGAPADDAAGHRRRRHQVRQDRGQRRLAGRRHDQPLRLLPVLAQRRGRLGGQAAQGLHRPHAARRSTSWSARCARSRSGGRRSGRWPPTSPRWCTGRRRRRRSRRPARRCSARATRARSTPRTLRDATAELPGATVAAGTRVVDALVAVRPGGLAATPPGGRIGEGGASVNNVKVTDPEARAAERRTSCTGRWPCSAAGASRSPRPGALPERRPGAEGAVRPGVGPA